LGVAQPSLSASLQKLEAQLGLQLFIRHHAQGVTPSPQGLRFLKEARSLVAHGNDFQRDSTVAGMLVEGELTIGSFSTIAPVYAPKLIAGFQKQYPKTRIRLEEGAQEQLVGGLRAGHYDLVLLYELDMPDDLKITELARLRPYVLLNANHSLAKKKSVSLHDLKNDPFPLISCPADLFHALESRAQPNQLRLAVAELAWSQQGLGFPFNHAAHGDQTMMASSSPFGP
jgi:DNA-binding transcriptional LysR family regulator